MTELLTRPSRTTPPTTAPADTGSLWWRGLLAASWAVAVGVASLVVLVLVIWATDSRAAIGGGAAVRTALQLWLVAQHVPVHVGAASIGVPPLLMTVLVAGLLAHAAAVLARALEVHDAAGVARVSAAVGLPYAALATFVAAGATSAPARPRPMAALFAGVVVGCAASAWGAARGTRSTGPLWRELPDEVRLVGRAAGLALAVLAAAATLLVAGAVAVHGAAVSHGMTALGGGPVGVAALVLLTVAFLPNAVVWAMAYVAGPGFAIAGSVVSTRAGAPGPLPALPLLAAVPHGAAAGLVGLAIVLTVVAAGGSAGWVVSRGGHPLTRSLALAAAAGGATGLIGSVLVAVSGGPAGPGTMAAVGPSPWQVGLVLAGEVAVVAAGTAAALTWRRGR
jgi:hypothetical protein